MGKICPKVSFSSFFSPGAVYSAFDAQGLIFCFARREFVKDNELYSLHGASKSREVVDKSSTRGQKVLFNLWTYQSSLWGENKVLNVRVCMKKKPQACGVILPCEGVFQDEKKLISLSLFCHFLTFGLMELPWFCHEIGDSFVNVCLQKVIRWIFLATQQFCECLLLGNVS